MKFNYEEYINEQIFQIREQVGNCRVLLGLSGGVDSSVCAALIEKAIPGQLTCVFVDHGFMRKNEGDDIEAAFAGKALNFVRVNAQERFLSKITGVTDPETKRKIIGEEFVRVFEKTRFDLFSSSAEQNERQNSGVFLAQGTIYTDIIESKGIKSHHNVGGLPENLDFIGIVEPLSSLYKEEARELGRKLGLPPTLTARQPFPGPGLAVRVIGKITQEKLDALREADAIVCEELAKLNPPPSQYFAVMTDTYSVGVKNGNRTYNPVVAIRAVETEDFMNCECFQLPYDVLNRLAERITSIDCVSRVVYDITRKPPGTIEWE
jgi:GMP synthase (glutamine-hydrolysing)